MSRRFLPGTFKPAHRCRHTFATRMLGAGFGTPDIAAYLGDILQTVLRI